MLLAMKNDCIAINLSILYLLFFNFLFLIDCIAWFLFLCSKQLLSTQIFLISLNFYLASLHLFYGNFES